MPFSCVSSRDYRGFPSCYLYYSFPSISNPANKFQSIQFILDSFALVAMDAQEVSCFKLVLGTRSTVFKAMLETPSCKEVLEGKVVIKDMDVFTLKSFWHFLLHNNIQQALMIHFKKEDFVTYACELALNLLVLGDRYDVRDLSMQGQKWLREELSPDNVLRIIKVANLVSARELVDFGLKFVHKNRKDSRLAPSKILITDDLPTEILAKLLQMLL